MKSKTLERILGFSTNRVELFGAQYKAYGIFGILNFPIAYFILHNAMQQDESIGLRLCAAILCVPLAFYKYLPEKIKTYLPLYWHVVLMYSLPFFGTYMLLKSHISLGWLSNITLALMLMILLLDWISLFVISFLGIILGIAVYAIFHGFINFYVRANADDFSLAFNQYSFLIVIAIFFSRHKEIIELKERLRSQEKLRSMENLVATIAHELRTPLASIAMVGELLKKQLPVLKSGAKGEELQKALKLIASVPERISTTTRNAFTVIDMVLMNLKKKPVSHEHKNCLMSECIESTLYEYPLDEKQKELIHWDKSVDFSFKGNELYLKHVFFNLLKNALYYMRAANKGELFIWLEKGDKYNALYFKDTSTGIAPEVLPHIFESFYSRTARGTGVGLAFCKSTMREFGGDIVCESVEGEFTTFVLTFPVVEED